MHCGGFMTQGAVWSPASFPRSLAGMRQTLWRTTDIPLPFFTSTFQIVWLFPHYALFCTRPVFFQVGLKSFLWVEEETDTESRREKASEQGKWGGEGGGVWTKRTQIKSTFTVINDALDTHCLNVIKVSPSAAVFVSQILLVDGHHSFCQRSPTAKSLVLLIFSFLPHLATSSNCLCRKLILTLPPRPPFL